MYISKYWRGYQLIGWSFNFVTIVGVFFMPESPKFLISKNKFDEARTSLRVIAKFNNFKGSLNFKFDKEVMIN